MDDIRGQLSEMLEQYGDMTVKELLTGTTNIALPKMVQARAILELGVKIDLRQYAASRVRVPRGAGKTVDIQVLTAPN